jgi:2-keto-3-deoxy-L-fuconate dehydrogenase
MESRRLAGKTAVVTAAGSGIGRESALAFAREGARVIGVDIDAAALRAVAGIEGHVVDVRDPAAIAGFAKTVGRADVLFNCAGMVPSGNVLEVEQTAWDAAFSLNVHGMFHMIRAFLPAMLEAKAGSIVNMSSVAGSITGVPNRCAYGATKAAVIGLTKSLQARLRATGDYAKARAEFEARQPMGRLGRPEEIAALAVHLASDESGFTTGQIHIIDGGWMI